MYQISVVLCVLCSAIAGATADGSSAVSTSYSVRSDRQPQGFDETGGYSKTSGYNKVVVTTYVMPKMMPSASYSTYIIHPMGMTPCSFSAADSDGSASVQKVEVKTENVSPNKYGVEDHTMDRRVIETYAMNAQTVNDDSKDGKVMEGHAMKGYVVEGHATNGYVIDGYEEGDITEAEAKQPQFFDKYQNTYDNLIGESNEPHAEWFKKDREREDYWDNMKKQFDAYYEEQYQRFLKDRHPYMSDSWNVGLEVQPMISDTYGLGNDRFVDFQSNMDYIPKYGNQFEKVVEDVKPKEPFLIRYEDDHDPNSEVEEIRQPPLITFMHGYDVHDPFGDRFGLKNGFKFNHDGFENGFGLREKYEPKWR